MDIMSETIETVSPRSPDWAPRGFVEIPFGPPGSFVPVNGPIYGKRNRQQLVAGFRVERRHCNFGNTCHGGMLVTFADMLLAAGANFQARLGRFLPTVSFSTEFFAAAAIGAWVEGACDVLKVTRTLVFTQSIIAADGTPMMRATSVMKLGPEAGPAAFDLNDILP
jgi:uncharacterized protein (TIGR00369 family)